MAAFFSAMMAPLLAQRAPPPPVPTPDTDEPREREPEIEGPAKFRGRDEDRAKAEKFIAGCRNVFEGRPRHFNTDRKKIRYAGGLMKEHAETWYQVPMQLEEEDRPDWFNDINLFWKEFRKHFGEADPKQRPRREIARARQTRDATSYVRYFQGLVFELNWDINCEPLHNQFYQGLSGRMKDELSRDEHLPERTTDLIARVLEIDARLTARAEDKAGGRVPPTDRHDDSEDDSRDKKQVKRPSEGGDDKTAAKSNKKRRTDKGPNEAGKPFRNWNRTADQKVPDDEMKLRRDYGECLVCGHPDHEAKTCRKASGNGVGA